MALAMTTFGIWTKSKIYLGTTSDVHDYADIPKDKTFSLKQRF